MQTSNKIVCYFSGSNVLINTRVQLLLLLDVIAVIPYCIAWHVLQVHSLLR